MRVNLRHLRNAFEGPPVRDRRKRQPVGDGSHGSGCSVPLLALTDAALKFLYAGLQTTEQLLEVHTSMAACFSDTILQYHVFRRDHGEMELKVRAAHEQGAWCAEDLKALTDAMHEERAAREEAERQLAAGRAVVDGLREDWQRKLRDRRKEVRAA